MNYTYHYSQKDAERFEKFLSELEGNFGGQRTPWGVRGGAIDLVTAFEVAVQWGPLALIAKTVVGKYLDGLLNTDSFKNVGTSHRRQIMALSQRATDTLRSLCEKLSTMARNGLNGVARDGELAVTLILPIENLSCYVVINQEGVDDQALELISEAVDRVVQLKSFGAIPDDAHTAQLFYDVDYVRRATACYGLRHS